MYSQSPGLCQNPSGGRDRNRGRGITIYETRTPTARYYAPELANRNPKEGERKKKKKGEKDVLLRTDGTSSPSGTNVTS